MRASRAGIVACAALGVALSLTACGGDGSSREGDTTSAAAPSRTAERPPGDTCSADLRYFVRSLDSLRDRLEAGLTYDLYLQSVERLKRAYRQLPVTDEPARCVAGAGLPAEKALNQNIEATNAWGDCLAESCDISKVEPEIKRRWARASVSITDAQDGLNRGGTR